MINPDLNKAIVDKWDTKNGVVMFDRILIYPTIEDYTRLIGTSHDCEKVIITCHKPSFKQRLSRTLGIKKKLLEAGGESLKYKRCLLDLLYDLYGVNKSYDRHKSAFLINHHM